MKNRTKKSIQKAYSWVRRHPVWIGSAIVVVAAAGLYGKRVAQIAVPALTRSDSPKQLATGKSMAELRESAKSDPGDAKVRLAVGHKLYKAGKTTAALRSYEYALDLDGRVADRELYGNLIASYTDPKTRMMAHDTIVSHKLVAIADGLDDLATDPRPEVRWSAIATLEKLERVSAEDYLGALAIDVKANDCASRQRAVERLGTFSDPRALAIVKDAARFDEQHAMWHKPVKRTCLENRAVMAERKIAAAQKETAAKMIAKK